MLTWLGVAVVLVGAGSMQPGTGTGCPLCARNKWWYGLMLAAAQRVPRSHDGVFVQLGDATRDNVRILEYNYDLYLAAVCE